MVIFDDLGGREREELFLKISIRQTSGVLKPNDITTKVGTDL
jgi:hypothetical protein